MGKQGATAAACPSWQRGSCEADTLLHRHMKSFPCHSHFIFMALSIQLLRTPKSDNRYGKLGILPNLTHI